MTDTVGNERMGVKMRNGLRSKVNCMDAGDTTISLSFWK